MISAHSQSFDRKNVVKYEIALAGFLAEFASELRMHDFDTLFSCIRVDQGQSLCDIVNSASELHFKAGHLAFAFNAFAQTDWYDVNFISIDLEFTCTEMTVFFTLRLEGRRAAVEIKNIVSWGSDQEIPSTEKFEKMIADCKIRYQ